MSGLQPVRLDRLLSERGYASRKEVRSLLSRPDCPITVAGVRPKKPDEKVLAAQVLWEGQPLDPERLVLLLHKPEGMTCSHDDRPPLVYELLPERFMERNPRPTSVGRLDKDTTGALIICDDGQLVHRLTSPRHKVPKVYQVRLARAPLESELEQLRQGGILLHGDDKPLLPCEVVRNGEDFVTMTLVEGRYHQIKRAFAALDNEVVGLHRSHFGPLDLNGLEKAQWRLLSATEIESFG